MWEPTDGWVKECERKQAEIDRLTKEVEDLRDKRDALDTEITALRATVARYEEALDFYGDEKKWSGLRVEYNRFACEDQIKGELWEDGGQRARAARQGS